MADFNELTQFGSGVLFWATLYALSYILTLYTDVIIFFCLKMLLYRNSIEKVFETKITVTTSLYRVRIGPYIRQRISMTEKKTQ